MKEPFFVCSWFLLLLLFISSSSAQECLPACSAGLTTCGSLPYNLYVTNTTDVLGAEFIAAKFYWESRGMLNFFQFFPEVFACANLLQKVMCNFLHPACNPLDPLNPTPIPICYGVCTLVQQTCASVYKYLPPEALELFNCSAVGPLGPRYSQTANCSNPPDGLFLDMLRCPGNVLKTPVTPFYTGVCTKFNKTAAPHLYEFCGPFLSEDVYVAMDWPMIQQWLDDFCVPYLNITTLFYPMSPQKCHKHIIALACRSILPSCAPRYVPFYGVYSGIPTISCESFCNLANENCAEFSETTNSSNYAVQACSVYPDENYNLTLSFFDMVTVNCSTFLYPPDAIEPYTIPDVACPKNTGRKIIHSDNDSYCDLRCPDASYSLTEWKRLSNLTIVGASLSLVAMSFLIISYLLQYERRKFPVTLHFCQFIATALFAVSFLIGGNEPEKTTWCYDAGTNATQDNNTRCGVQGFFFIFFGLALTAWCLVIAFIMFYAVVFTKKIKLMERYTILFHLFAWGIALVFSVAAVATKSIGYGPPLAWCFIHFSGFGFSSGGVSKDYIFFYIPIAVLFFSILFMFICTVIKIIYVRHQGLAHISVARKGSRTFRAQVRVLIFIFIISVICFTIFEWRLQIQGNSTLAATGLNWTYCKIKHELGLPTDDICDGDTSPARTDYHHTAFESFLLSGVGILIFIGFGSDPTIYSHWRTLGNLALSKDWNAMYQLIVHGKDPYPMSRSPTNSGSGARKSKDSASHSKDSNSNFSKETDTTYPRDSGFADITTASIELTGISDSQDLPTVKSNKQIYEL